MQMCSALFYNEPNQCALLNYETWSGESDNGGPVLNFRLSKAFLTFLVLFPSRVLVMYLLSRQSSCEDDTDLFMPDTSTERPSKEQASLSETRRDASRANLERTPEIRAAPLDEGHNASDKADTSPSNSEPILVISTKQPSIQKKQSGQVLPLPPPPPPALPPPPSPLSLPPSYSPTKSPSLLVPIVPITSPTRSIVSEQQKFEHTSDLPKNEANDDVTIRTKKKKIKSRKRRHKKHLTAVVSTVKMQRSLHTHKKNRLKPVKRRATKHPVALHGTLRLHHCRMLAAYMCIFTL